MHAPFSESPRSYTVLMVAISLILTMSLFSAENDAKVEIEELLQKIEDEVQKSDRSSPYYYELKELFSEALAALDGGELKELYQYMEKLRHWKRPVANELLGKKATRIYEKLYLEVLEESRAEQFDEVTSLSNHVADVLRTDPDLATIEDEIRKTRAFEALVNETSSLHKDPDSRIWKRVASIRMLLEKYSDFLKARALGNASSADSKLKSLSVASIGVPVFSVNDVEALKRSTPIGLSAILSGVKTLDQIPALRISLEEWEKTVPASASYVVGEIEGTVSSLESIKALADKNRTQDACDRLVSLKLSSSWFDREVFESLRSDALNSLVLILVESSTSVVLEKNESAESYLFRALKFECQNENYELGLKLIGILQKVATSNKRFDWISKDAEGIEAYVKAQRFYKSGDGAAAVPHLRDVISIVGGKYTPTEKAQKILRELADKNPSWLHAPIPSPTRIPVDPFPEL
tara:strand:- start:6006 stop:7403 length:1398 start_codon:yes stop_codon:yes gene_type:complete